MAEKEKKSKKGILLLFSVSIVAVFATIYFLTRDTKIPQGEITYQITYPYNDVSGFTEAMLPKEVVVIFKGPKLLTTIKKGKLFQTFIYVNEETKEMEMRYLFGSDKFYTEMSAEDQDAFIASQPKYKIENTEEKDSLSGLFAKKYKIQYENGEFPEFESWFTEGISIQNASRVSSYAPIVGMPLIYDIDRYGARMHLEIVDFKEKEIKDEEFDRPSSVSSISYEEYERKIQELFDLLLE